MKATQSRRRLLAGIPVALFGLAGCLGVPLEDTTNDAEISPEDQSASSAGGSTQEKQAESDSSSKKQKTKDTPTEEWEQPDPPKSPTQEKDDDRITDMDIINTTESDEGDGFSDFDLQVGANTWMKDVDPEPETDGDPYFTAELNGELVARTDIVPFRKNGSFKIEILPDALSQFDPGTLDIEVFLFDKDTSRADLYGTYTDEVKYSP